MKACVLILAIPCCLLALYWWPANLGVLQQPTSQVQETLALAAESIDGGGAVPILTWQWRWSCTTWACVKPINGPVYMMGQAFLLYAGFVTDTMFIRFTLIVGAILTCVWNQLGNANFPDWTNNSLPGTKVDAYIWCLLSVFVNGVPALRQFLYNDAKIMFGGPHEDVKETMWRIWYRRTGVSRADFKLIVDAGEFIEFKASECVPMVTNRLEQNGGVIEDGIDNSAADGSLGDIYYYVAGGILEGSAPYPEGPKLFDCHAGDFVNMYALLTLLGSAPAASALQTGPPTARIVANSTYSTTLLPPAIHGGVLLGELHTVYDTPRTPEANLIGLDLGGEHESGALLFRWCRQDLVKQLFDRPSFAPDALRLAVSQAALDSLYKATLDAPGMKSHKRAYFAIDSMRRRANAAELPRDAATQKRSFIKQWWLCTKRPWQISPQERAVNAVRCGSQELQRVEQMRINRLAVADMRRVATCAYDLPDS